MRPRSTITSAEARLVVRELVEFGAFFCMVAAVGLVLWPFLLGGVGLWLSIVLAIPFAATGVAYLFEAATLELAVLRARGR